MVEGGKTKDDGVQEGHTGKPPELAVFTFKGTGVRWAEAFHSRKKTVSVFKKKNGADNRAVPH